MLNSEKCAKLTPEPIRNLEPGPVQTSPISFNSHSYEELVKEWDDDLGYGDYAETCRAAFTRSPGQADVFLKNGFERFQLLAPRKIESLLSIIKKAETDPRTFDDRGEGLGVIYLTRPEIVRTVLGTILNATVDQKMTAFFKSEYRVLWFSVQKVASHEAENVSFKWHKDLGPSRHLKLILYLSDTAETGGRTDFIDRTTTQKLRHAGYDFVEVGQRASDLHPFAAQSGIDLTVHDDPFTAGEAVIFQPPEVLHRGVMPTLAPRYTITLCLAPHTESWMTWLECLPPMIFQDETASAWERDCPWLPQFES